MPDVITNNQVKRNSSNGFFWLAYERTGFTVVGNPLKPATGLKRPARGAHDDASALPRKSGEVTDASGTLAETVDYYPYGGIRLDNTTSTAQPEIRKYIDQPFDSTTNLNLFGARYQDPNRGQFLSEDPVFLGNPNGQNLEDPQSLNAYSYSEDNETRWITRGGLDRLSV
jgi:RHS repeat-associated protein